LKGETLRISLSFPRRGRKYGITAVSGKEKKKEKIPLGREASFSKKEVQEKKSKRTFLA